MNNSEVAPKVVEKSVNQNRSGFLGRFADAHMATALLPVVLCDTIWLEGGLNWPFDYMVGNVSTSNQVN